MNSDKQSRSRSDSEHSVEPLIEHSLTLQTTARKRNNLSESEILNEPTIVPISSISPSSAPATPIPQPPPASSSSTSTSLPANSKLNLARTAILLAAKRAAHHNNPSNTYDGSTFTLIDGTEDEADSSAGLFKQRLDTLDFTDEVIPFQVFLIHSFLNVILVFSSSFHRRMKSIPIRIQPQH